MMREPPRVVHRIGMARIALTVALALSLAVAGAPGGAPGERAGVPLPAPPIADTGGPVAAPLGLFNWLCQQYPRLPGC